MERDGGEGKEGQKWMDGVREGRGRAKEGKIEELNEGRGLEKERVILRSQIERGRHEEIEQEGGGRRDEDIW